MEGVFHCVTLMQCSTENPLLYMQAEIVAVLDLLKVRTSLVVNDCSYEFHLGIKSFCDVPIYYIKKEATIKSKCYTMVCTGTKISYCIVSILRVWEISMISTDQWYRMNNWTLSTPTASYYHSLRGVQCEC